MNTLKHFCSGKKVECENLGGNIKLRSKSILPFNISIVPPEVKSVDVITGDSVYKGNEKVLTKLVTKKVNKRKGVYLTAQMMIFQNYR